MAFVNFGLRSRCRLPDAEKETPTPTGVKLKYTEPVSLAGAEALSPLGLWSRALPACVGADFCHASRHSGLAPRPEPSDRVARPSSGAGRRKSPGRDVHSGWSSRKCCPGARRARVLLVRAEQPRAQGRQKTACAQAWRNTFESTRRAAGRTLIKFQERLASGRLPLRNELREGPHTAICAKARSNTVPFAASASSTGVWRSARRQGGGRVSAVARG